MAKSEYDDPADPITEAIIGCAYDVGNELGPGFLEKVYENALAFEVRQAGLKCLQQHVIKVKYKRVIVGEYAADMFVDDRVIIELKAAEAIDPLHVAQTLNYLKASGIRVGLVINFGARKVQVKRLVLDQQRYTD